MQRQGGRAADYDIFLSHAYCDRDLVEQAHAELEGAGYSVYVDWIEDATLDRSAVDERTADLLRRRMQRCGSLFFAVSTRSPLSRWMPWELGYGDAWTGRVFVFPLDDNAADWAKGQEYLKLYEIVDRRNLIAFLALHLRKAKDEMLPPGALEVTAVHGERVIENLPRLALDPALAMQWCAEFWKAWWAMMGVRL